VDLVALEKDKIRGAIRTDFILSAEIIAITLGSVAGTSLLTQFGVMALVAVALTIGVYGLVAAIVKLDDAGLALARLQGDGGLRDGLRGLGRLLLGARPG
jgi:predicted DNA repair protein MutK